MPALAVPGLFGSKVLILAALVISVLLGLQRSVCFHHRGTEDTEKISRLLFAFLSVRCISCRLRSSVFICVICGQIRSVVIRGLKRERPRNSPGPLLADRTKPLVALPAFRSLSSANGGDTEEEV